MQNSGTHPVLVGAANHLTRRVWVLAPAGHPLLRVGSAVYVNGEGVDALIADGTLTLA